MKNSAVFGYTVTRTWEALSKSCNAATEIFHCFNVASHELEVKLQKISAGVSPMCIDGCWSTYFIRTLRFWVQ